MMRTALQVLNDTRIASPCDESWRSMRGDPQVGHCNRCNRKVFNLSTLSAAEAAQLLERHGHDLCVRLYRRRDGTVMTKDCGRPIASRWRVAAWAASLFASVFAVGCVHQGKPVTPDDSKHDATKPTTQPVHSDGESAGT